MNLEQLIEQAQAARRWLDEHPQDRTIAARKADDALAGARLRIAAFVLDHADELIAWERAHAARTSFDDYEIGT